MVLVSTPLGLTKFFPVSLVGDESCKLISIFNGCEVLIENSVTRVTVRLVMLNSYPSDGIFN